MVVGVVGSRCFQDSALLQRELASFPVCSVVSGGAQGADSLAAQWAVSRGLHLVVHKPDYQRFGRSAPLRRNELIVRSCELLVAFWDGRSRGTKHAIDLAVRLGVRVLVVPFS